MSGVEVVRALVERLGPVAERCAVGDADRMPSYRVLQVSDFEVETASRCQAKLAGPPEPFEFGIHTAVRAMAHRAIPLLDGPESVVAAMAAAMRATIDDRDDWLGPHLGRATRATRAQIAVRATTWLSRTMQLTGRDRFPGWSAGQRLVWTYPQRALRLRATVDLMPPPADGSGPVMVVPSPSDARDAKVAFAALLWAATRPGRSGAQDERSDAEDAEDVANVEIEVVAHATGQRTRTPIAALVEAGLDAAERAATGLVQRSTGPEGLDRSPAYFTCDGCAWFDDCEPRRLADEAAASIRGGVRLRQA